VHRASAWPRLRVVQEVGVAEDKATDAAAQALLGALRLRSGGHAAASAHCCGSGWRSAWPDGCGGSLQRAAAAEQRAKRRSGAARRTLVAAPGAAALHAAPIGAPHLRLRLQRVHAMV
jgi:hypothetical protein